LFVLGLSAVLTAPCLSNVPFIYFVTLIAATEIYTCLSLALIVLILVVTVVASLLSPAGRAQTAVGNARRHATRYLDLGYEADQTLRERTYNKMLGEEKTLAGLPAKYRRRIREGETELVALLERAHIVHADRIARIEAGLPLRM